MEFIEASVLVAEVYKTCNDGQFAKDFGLKNQIRRAAVSIMSNIAEGFARRTNKNSHDSFISLTASLQKFNRCCTSLLTKNTSTIQPSKLSMKHATKSRR